MTPKPRTLALAAAFAAVVSLSGCGGGDEPAGAGAKADSAPSATADDAQVEVTDPSTGSQLKVDGDAATTMSDQVGQQLKVKALPDGFPASVPVVAGTIVGGTTGGPGDPYSYTAILTVEGSNPAAVMDGVTRQLKAAGFKATQGMAVSAMSNATFTSKKWGVAVNSVAADGKVTVTYIVTAPQ